MLYYLKAHYAIKALADDNGVVLPEKQQEEVNAEIQEYIDQMKSVRREPSARHKGGTAVQRAV